MAALDFCYFELPHTGGRRITFSTNAPDGHLKRGELWVNTAEYGGVPHAYNGSSWPARGVWAFGYDSAAYFTITQADAGGVTFNCTSDGTAGFTFSDPVTLGHTGTGSVLILTGYGRISTGTAGGSSCDWDASFTYSEGMELRYAVTSWSGTGNAVKGIYLRMDNEVANASGGLRGMEIYGVANNVNTKNIAGVYTSGYVKGTAAVAVTTVYGLEANFSMDANRVGNCTISTEAAAILAKVLSGVCADYTVIHGAILRFGDMDGASRKFGSGIMLVDDTGMSGTCTLTNGLYINIGCTADIKLQNAATIDNVTAGLVTLNGCLTITPTRITGTYAYGVTIDGAEVFFTGGAASKSNLVDIQGERPAGTTPTGDSYDSVLKLAGTNYAVSTAYIMRGLNGKISNEDGGSLALIEHNLSANNKIGSTCLTVRGLTITAENYGTCATEFGGIDLVLKNEGAVATTEYGIRVRNLNASLATAINSAFLVSDTGANTGWNYGLNLSGASIVKGDIALHAVDAGSLPCIITSGAATDDAGIVSQVGADSLYADGSLYISVTDSGGALFQKKNDEWTAIT